MNPTAQTNTMLPPPGSNANVMIGSDANDNISATAAPDFILAEGGHDTITGVQTNDTVYAGAGNDHVYGTGGAIYGEGGNDTISTWDSQNLTAYTGRTDAHGGDGNDTISLIRGRADGGNGNDSILAFSDSTLIGGKGRDRMEGTRNNVFVFNAMNESGHGAQADTVQMNGPGNKIDLSGILNGNGPLGNLFFSEFSWTDQFTGVPGQVMIESLPQTEYAGQMLNTYMLSLDGNGDGSADFQIRVLTFNGGDWDGVFDRDDVILGRQAPETPPLISTLNLPTEPPMI